MSSASMESIAFHAPAPVNRRSLWLRQVAAILRLEVKKNFISKRAFLIYLPVAFPVLLMAALSVEFIARQNRPDSIQEANLIFANLYEGLILRTMVFFGCAWIFMNLFRGEIVDRSLHYYFLAPLRREVLVTGKYVSGIITTIILFTVCTAGSLLFLYVGLGAAGRNYLLNGPGMRQGLTYIGITWLACVGYGAVFMVIGLFFRNPIIPALLIYGLEFINFLLPPVLKKISVVHYLHSLVPIQIPEGPFAMVADPTPAWIAVPGLIIFTAVVLTLASYRIRKMQITYGGE